MANLMVSKDIQLNQLDIAQIKKLFGFWKKMTTRSCNLSLPLESCINEALRKIHQFGRINEVVRFSSI